MQAAKKLFLLVIACVAVGWICGGMENEALSYIIGIVGGLFMWYLLFGEVL